MKIVLACLISLCHYSYALPIKTLYFSTHKTLKVEIAQNDKDRAQGLMFREKLPEGQGMLFVFSQPQRMSFWMKNTFIPLTIGFFDAKRKLIETIDMKPAQGPIKDENLPHYESSQPAVYALEVPQGWFVKNHIKPGTTFLLK